MRFGTFTTLSSVLAGVLATAAMSGCGDSSAKSDEIVYVSPLERQVQLVEEVEEPEPPVSLEDNPDFQEIIRGFRANALDLFKRPDIERRLPQIEKIFVSTGHYLELVGIYQRAVESQGPSSPAAPRLAWAYIRLGQRHQAKQLLDRLSEARPEDPLVPFLQGSFWFNEAQDSRTALARTIVAWRRTLELDPDFKGYEDITAEAMRSQLARLADRLGEPARQVLDQKPDTPGSPGSGAATPSGETGSATGDTPTEPSDEETVVAEGEEPGEDAKQPDIEANPAPKDAAPEPLPESTDTRPLEPEDKGPPPLAVRLTEAQLAASQGNLDEAKQLFRSVLDDHPDHVEAELGLVKLTLQANPHDTDARATLEELAERDDLSAHQAYEIGLLAGSKLQDDGLRDDMWKRVRKLDPDFARQVGINESD